MFYSYIYHECLNTSCTEISSTYYKIMELKEKSLYGLKIILLIELKRFLLSAILPELEALMLEYLKVHY